MLPHGTRRPSAQPGQNLLAEDPCVVGVGRVDRADHEPLGPGVDVRAQHAATRSGPPTITWSPTPSRSAFAAAASSSSPSTTSPPHVTVNGERGRRRRQVGGLLPGSARRRCPTGSSRRRAQPRPRAPRGRNRRPTPGTRGRACRRPRRAARRPGRPPCRSRARRSRSPPGSRWSPAPIATSEAFGPEDARQRVEAVGQHRVRPQRRARDERAHRDPLRRRRDRAHQREHLDRGATPTGAVRAEQVVVREHAVEPDAPRPRPRPPATCRRRRGTTAA